MIIKYIEELEIKFKNVNFIEGHLNWPDFDNIFVLCEKYKNVFTCISGCLDGLDRNKRDNQVKNTIEILNRYLKKYPNLRNKLMYGTDFFSDDLDFIDVSDYIKIVEALELSESEKENLIHKYTFCI